jgi:hypothetical protein
VIDLVRSGNWDCCLCFSLFLIYLVSVRLHALILKLGFHYLVYRIVEAKGWNK